MGGYYSVSRSNTALSTTADFLAVVGAVTHSFRIHEVSVGGMGTASAANELAVARSAGGNTAGGGITPSPLRPSQAAAGFTAATTWTTIPSVTAVLLRLPVNANGAIFRWVAKPGTELEFVGTDQASYRPIVGSSNVTMHTLVEEF